MSEDTNDFQYFIKKRPFPAYSGDEPYIFVSYAHKDAERVFPELVRFKNEGFHIWYDQGIAPGMGWRKGIVKNLYKSSLFIVFLSEASAQSEAVLKEIILANEKGIPIVPIYLEYVELNEEMKYELLLIQAIFKCDMTPQEYDIQWKRAFEIIENLPQEVPEPPKPAEKPEVSKVSTKNFKYLDDLIHSGEKTVNLDCDIKFDYSEKSVYTNGILVDVDNLVIEGNNHFIDADTLSSIFNITGKNVLIKNTHFKNGNHFSAGENKHENGGGAIYIEKDASLTVENCKFLNNYSESDGGAIFNKSDKLEIVGCAFEDNSCKSSGGAIANFNILKLFKTNFKRNKSFNGGAIYNYHESNVTLRGCKIRNNSGSMFAGGIYNYGVLKMEESNFTGNASRGGGAILNYGYSEIGSTDFKKNSADFGGAIFNMVARLIQYSTEFSSTNGEDEGLMKFADCSFVYNSANNLGGVITNLSKCKFDGCVFGKNSAKDLAHIISNGPERILNNEEDVKPGFNISVLTLSDCKFRIKGDVENNAVYNQRNCLLKVHSDTIINKMSPDINNAIFLNEGEIKFI